MNLVYPISRPPRCYCFAPLEVQHASRPGYTVQEWSGLEQRWVVRARHAHAWTLAWVDGTWREVDTTPPAWVGEETKLASV